MGNIPGEEEMRQVLRIRHGDKIQDKFDAASVAVCGLGGLGSNVAVSLARAGVGRLIPVSYTHLTLPTNREV